MNNIHYSFMGYIPCYTQEKGWDLRKKCSKWSKSAILGSRWRHNLKMVKDLLKKFVSKWSLEYSEQSLLWFYVVNFRVPFENGAKSEKIAQNAQKVLFMGSRWRQRAKMGKILGGKICFNIISKVFKTISTMVLWGNFHVIVDKKAEICKNLLKMLKKCYIWGQDDVEGPKRWKIFGENLF